ncbi:LysM peptidoglycan-binding domain-containing protein [Geomonas sp. Red32]|uniref:LysM peptidoglycan-binding domain-containing protein n=1 Tax=Geomonas sp. Red32 TaxID=2912856 RepID=UPI00202D0881|nr:LysM peptidoglycan-binding domain-containing protein [Geomonas sp. Red32]MCM0080020.1 LysM peptidoglycan-binding domain-containing protein [Geomonas sp. Red32]
MQLAFPAGYRHLLLATLLVAGLPLSARALDAKFEIAPQQLTRKAPAASAPAGPSHAPASSAAPSPSAPSRAATSHAGTSHAGTSRASEKHEGSRETVRYTVKPGDQLYRILAREYGVTGDRADRLVRETRQLNHLSNVRGLQVGSTILLPAGMAGSHRRTAARHVASPARRSKTVSRRVEAAYQEETPGVPVSPSVAAGSTSPGAPLLPLRLSQALPDAREVWGRLVTAPAAPNDRYGYLSSTFSLSLDPDRYPLLPAQDGGSILVDANGSLPPLVKSLILEKNPKLRIVNEDPDNTRRFYRSLLDASHFYSFEEDFQVYLGADPKITVRADFKIEKTPESLAKQDITLLNVDNNRPAVPEGLVKMLAGSGFNLIEANRYHVEGKQGEPKVLYQVSEKEPTALCDAVLDALSIRPQGELNLDLYAGDNLGIRLEVPVDRYFEIRGQRYVVALFRDDPVMYTLVRLLETKGYKVIVLQKGDDLAQVADRMLSRMQIPARYREQDLWSLRDVGYGVKLAGTMVREGENGRTVFITDKKVDPLVQELAEANGYRMQTR